MLWARRLADLASLRYDPVVVSDTSPDPGQITRLLLRVREGDVAAREELLPFVYARLRELGFRLFQSQRPGQTLQPTAIVHEAYMGLVDKPIAWEGSGHFYAIAATAMREIIIDHVRKRSRLKRGGPRLRVTFDEGMLAQGGSEVDAETLQDALSAIEKIRPRVGQIIDCRFFAGMTNRQTADALGVSLRTVEAEWTFARAWLRRALSA